jgi:glycosyltransferase involved in cell wall biosynthesis
MFEHEKTALLTPLVFDPDFGIHADNEKFAENIIKLIENKKLREMISESVKTKFIESFMLEIMIEKIVKIYREL